MILKDSGTIILISLFVASWVVHCALPFENVRLLLWNWTWVWIDLDCSLPKMVWSIYSRRGTSKVKSLTPPSGPLKTPMIMIGMVAKKYIYKKACLTKQIHFMEAWMYQLGCLIRNELLIFAADHIHKWNVQI